MDEARRKKRLQISRIYRQEFAAWGRDMYFDEPMWRFLEKVYDHEGVGQ